MSTERYNGCEFQYVKDGESKGKVKVYVKKGTTSRSQHLNKGRNGSPPSICFKKNSKPSSLSEARSLARTWANKYS